MATATATPAPQANENARCSRGSGSSRSSESTAASSTGSGATASSADRPNPAAPPFPSSTPSTPSASRLDTTSAAISALLGRWESMGERGGTVMTGPSFSRGHPACAAVLDARLQTACGSYARHAIYRRADAGYRPRHERGTLRAMAAPHVAGRLLPRPRTGHPRLHRPLARHGRPRAGPADRDAPAGARAVRRRDPHPGRRADRGRRPGGRPLDVRRRLPGRHARRDRRPRHPDRLQRPRHPARRGRQVRRVLGHLRRHLALPAARDGLTSSRSVPLAAMSISPAPRSRSPYTLVADDQDRSMIRPSGASRNSTPPSPASTKPSPSHTTPDAKG